MFEQRCDLMICEDSDGRRWRRFDGIKFNRFGDVSAPVRPGVEGAQTGFFVRQITPVFDCFPPSISGVQFERQIRWHGSLVLPQHSPDFLDVTPAALKRF